MRFYLEKSCKNRRRVDGPKPRLPLAAGYRLQTLLCYSFILLQIFIRA